MRDYLDQIEAASAANLYYLALSGALVLPDMAAAMEAADGRTSGARYVAWFDQNVAPEFHVFGTQFISGADCYGLRCSLLHQGRMTPHQGSYSRVIFLEPGTTDNLFHLNIMNDALNIDVGIFLATMVRATRAWLTVAEPTARYQQNFASTMQRHPQGLAPYIVGMPVIG